jgi:ribosome biogenesis protein ERB1
MKKKFEVQDSSQLIPEMPSPNDLKPFPTRVSIEYKYHSSCIRSISVSPCGRFLASGDISGNLVIWQVDTGRILRTFKLKNNVIDCIEWNPSKQYCIIAVANEESVFIIEPKVYTKKINELTALHLQ